MYLYEKFLHFPLKKHLSLELFNNPLVDHFFVIIGRKESTDSADPTTWNADTIICDPWAQGKSYAIGNVNFKDVSNDIYRVIKYLKPEDNSGKDLILKKDVLAKANGDHSRVIIAQDCMVLRTRVDFENNTTSIFNINIPMLYELWDFPKSKHYKKQKKMDETTSQQTFIRKN